MHFTQKFNHNFLQLEFREGNLEDVSWSMSLTKLNQTLQKLEK